MRVDDRTPEKKTCGESVFDTWHSHRCGKPAKYKVALASGREIFRCGIHVKRLQRGALNRVEAL